MEANRTIRAAIYARVSTTHGQDPETQLRELRAYVERRGWELAGEFVDKGISGAKDRRPALDRLKRQAKGRHFDAVVVWKFDRFARSVRHLVLALDEFRALGVAFVSITEAVDTSTPLGRAMFTVVGAIAEFERDLIRERVRAGVARARSEGKSLGRPRTELDLAQVRARLATGESLRAVARALGTSHTTLRRALAREGGTESPPPEKGRSVHQDAA